MASRRTAADRTGSSVGSNDVVWCKTAFLCPFFWFSRQMVTASAWFSSSWGESLSSRTPWCHSLMSFFRRGMVRRPAGVGVYSPTRRRKKNAKEIRWPVIRQCWVGCWPKCVTIQRMVELGRACCWRDGGSACLAERRKAVTLGAKAWSPGCWRRGSSSPLETMSCAHSRSALSISAPRSGWPLLASPVLRDSAKARNSRVRSSW